MKTQQLAHVFGTPVSSHVAYLGEMTPKRILHDPASASRYQISSSSIGSLKLKQNKVDRMSKLGGKQDNLANGIRELGPKITEIVKGKLSLGAKIIRAGGVEKIFKHHFSIREGEKLLKASKCYLSTTVGPIAGLLFISTDKVAFCSDRSIKLSSPTGEFVRIRYKVLIPVGKILRANESQNMKRPSKKYIEIAQYFQSRHHPPSLSIYEEGELIEGFNQRLYIVLLVKRLWDPSTASASASAYKVDRMEKFERKEGNLASGIREHVKLGPKITETVKGKLSLGAKIIRAGGVEKIFKQNFSNREGEKLLKASQCYLSTTTGPIAGLLFISTDKVAFFSDRSIKLSSPIGEFIRLRYKVVIPVSKDKESQ
ncbi:unnamed protein product [Camellia sinensis]